MHPMDPVQDVWTDRLSEYLDDELPRDERYAIESHLAGCERCAATLGELRRVAERARALPSRPPDNDLWSAVAERIGDEASPVTHAAAFRPREPWRISFTLPQLAAASVLLALLSGGVAWRIQTTAGKAGDAAGTAAAGRVVDTPVRPTADARNDEAQAGPGAPDAEPLVVPVNFADDQYDAAVADLERALKEGRGRLDKATVGIVEQNLRTIDQAINQARKALAADPANSYLSTHLVETRRRKLDLLRRATALVSESN